MKEQLANRKSLETRPPRKKRKKHSDASDDEKLLKTRIHELSLSYKDFECSPIILKYEEASSKWYEEKYRFQITEDAIKEFESLGS